MRNEKMTQEYAEKLRPLMELAHRAYGAKNQNTPAHRASNEYTRLLTEFVEKKGSLIELAEALGVSYSGLRRRVYTSSVPTMNNRNARKKVSPEIAEAAIARVAEARSISTVRYHEQLSIEYYENGVSLSVIAKGLGISNAGPLYYGVQRHARRMAQA